MRAPGLDDFENGRAGRDDTAFIKEACGHLAGKRSDQFGFRQIDIDRPQAGIDLAKAGREPSQLQTHLVEGLHACVAAVAQLGLTLKCQFGEFDLRFKPVPPGFQFRLARLERAGVEPCQNLALGHPVALVGQHRDQCSRALERQAVGAGRFDPADIAGRALNRCHQFHRHRLDEDGGAGIGVDACGRAFVDRHRAGHDEADRGARGERCRRPVRQARGPAYGGPGFLLVL